MRQTLITLSAATLIALSGCASDKMSSSDNGASMTATGISAEAQAALSQAEAAVKEAKSKYALWTTAQKAMAAADEAAKKGDSAGVIKNAQTAEELAKLGIKQLSEPTLELQNL
jgi:murein lipoprotein